MVHSAAIFAAIALSLTFKSAVAAPVVWESQELRERDTELFARRCWPWQFPIARPRRPPPLNRRPSMLQYPALNRWPGMLRYPPPGYRRPRHGEDFGDRPVHLPTSCPFPTPPASAPDSGEDNEGVVGVGIHAQEGCPGRPGMLLHPPASYRFGEDCSGRPFHHSPACQFPPSLASVPHTGEGPPTDADGASRVPAAQGVLGHRVEDP